jgi:hypothetical protein
LDGETIRDVVERLRSFASTFASSSSPFTGDEEGVDNVGYVETAAEGEVVLGAGGIPSIKTTITATTTTVDSNDVAMDAGYDDGAEVRMSTPARSSNEGINLDPSDRRGRRRARSVSRRPSSSFSASTSMSSSSFVEERLYSNAVGGIFSPITDGTAPVKESAIDERIEIAIALVERVSLFWQAFHENIWTFYYLTFEKKKKKDQHACHPAVRLLLFLL